MAREDDALARRAAREARRAARRTRDLPEDQPSESGDDNGSTADPVRAAREAATAAAVGAAVGAVRALTARHRDGDDESVAEDEEPLAEHEEEADEDEATMPEAEAEADDERRDDRGGRDRRERKAADLGQVERAVQTAREQLRQLNGTEAESVSSFARTRDGWRVTLEVVEVRRIPETTDVLASYAVELDDDGNLVAYERVRRYQRSEALDGS